MHVTLKGKGDFADVIMLRILRWRDDLGLSGSALNSNHMEIDKREAQGDLTHGRGVGKVTTEAEIEVM